MECRRSSSGKYSLESHRWVLFEKIQKLLTDLQCEPEHEAGSSSCECSTTLNGMQKETKNNVNTRFTDSCGICSQIPSLSLVFLGAWIRRKMLRNLYTHKPDGSWDQMAEEMMKNIARSGHPIFRASIAFEGGELRSRGGGKKPIHFNGSDENIELLSPHSDFCESALSVYGAMADLSAESENSSNCQKTRNYPNCVLMRDRSLLNENSTSFLLKQKKDNRCNTHAESTRCLEMKRGLL